MEVIKPVSGDSSEELINPGLEEKVAEDAARGRVDVFRQSPRDSVDVLNVSAVRVRDKRGQTGVRGNVRELCSCRETIRLVTTLSTAGEEQGISGRNEPDYKTTMKTFTIPVTWVTLIADAIVLLS